MGRRFLIAAALVLIVPPAVPIAAPVVRSTVTRVFQHEIPNISGKTLISVIVNFAPGAKSGSHRHAPSAFIYAYVLSGAVRSQVDDQPVQIYHAGQTWFEPPGAHHVVSENASASEPAQVMAVFVVDTSDKPLTIPDAE